MPIHEYLSPLLNDQFQHFASKTAGITVLASVCAYGGTFFFTSHPPITGAMYFGTVALIGQVAYQALVNLKECFENQTIKHLINVIQLLEIPFFFYFLHGGSQFLTAAIKLEIVAATAYFTAIPLFFHLGIETWNDPSAANIAMTMGVMMPLASGLRAYSGLFK